MLRICLRQLGTLIDISPWTYVTGNSDFLAPSVVLLTILDSIPLPFKSGVRVRRLQARGRQVSPGYPGDEVGSLR